VNAFRRLTGLIDRQDSLDWYLTAGFAIRGVNRPMKRPHPRHRLTSRRRSGVCSNPRLTSKDTLVDPNDPDIRHDLVARIRSEIAAGTYDTPDKLESALFNMTNHLQD